MDFSIISVMSTTSTSGWNRSTSTPKPAPKRPSALRGILAGLVVVAILGAAAYFIFSGKDVQPRAKAAKETGLIREVTPAAAPKAEEPVAARRKWGKDWRQKQISMIEQKYGTNLTQDLKTTLYFLKNPPQRSFKPKTEYSFLRHSSERTMYSLLAAEPGAFMLEPVEVGEGFNQDFINALVDKIEITNEDSDEVRKIKQFVTDAKKEIAALVKSEGKKPSELLNEHAKALYDLGRFQQNLENELNAARRNADLSDQDVEDMFRAANVLRKQKGLDELPIPGLTRRAQQLRRQQARDAKRAAQKKDDGKKKEIKK